MGGRIRAKRPEPLRLGTNLPTAPVTESLRLRPDVRLLLVHHADRTVQWLNTMVDHATNSLFRGRLSVLLANVLRRQRLINVARRTYVFTLVLACLYGLLLMASRFLAVFPDVFTAWSLLVIPACALVLGLLFHQRPNSLAAARMTDASAKTEDLFLTSILLDSSASEYAPLVSRKSNEKAEQVEPKKVVPYRWAPGTRYSTLAMCSLWVGVLFLPQLDPFGREEKREQQLEREQNLKETAKATKLRRANIEKAEPTSSAVEQALEDLKKTFQTMKPDEQKGNFKRLSEKQQELGRMWQTAANRKLAQSGSMKLPTQRFGATSPRQEEWKKELKKGRTLALRKELDALQELARQIAETEDPGKRRKLEQELKQRIGELQNFAATGLKSQPLEAALSRALSQLQMGQMPNLSQEAMQGMHDSLDLAGLELSQLQKMMDELQSLDQALDTLRLAQQCNGMSCLNGAGCSGLQGMGDYASLYSQLMRNTRGSGGGMKGPGTGKGGLAPEDETLDTGFKTEKSKSALRAGKILMTWETQQLSDPGHARENYIENVAAVRQGVNEAILSDQIPPGYHDSIQKYFDTLRRQHAETEPVSE
jgi:hypothetical protein